MAESSSSSPGNPRIEYRRPQDTLSARSGYTTGSRVGTISANFVSNETRNGHTVYTIVVSVVPADVSWEVRRRYRDVHALHKELRRIRNATDVPGGMPPKTYFCGRLDQDVISMRAESLQLYLNTAMLAALDGQVCGELSLPLWYFLFVPEQISDMEEMWKERLVAAPEQVLVAHSGTGVNGLYDLEKVDSQRSELRFGLDGVPRFEKGGYRRRGKLPMHLMYRIRTMRWIFAEIPDPSPASEQEEDRGKWLVRSAPASLKLQAHQVGQWEALEGPSNKPTDWKSISPAICVLPMTTESMCSVTVSSKSGEVLHARMHQATTVSELKLHIEGEWGMPHFFQQLRFGQTVPSDCEMLGGIGRGDNVDFTFSTEVWDANTRVHISGAGGTCSSLINGIYTWQSAMTFANERGDTSLKYERDEANASAGYSFGRWRVADQVSFHILLDSLLLDRSTCPSRVAEWSEWCSSRRYDNHGISFTPELMMQQDGKWQSCPGLIVKISRGKRQLSDQDD